jgi:hypothetical protein
MRAGAIWTAVHTARRQAQCRRAQGAKLVLPLEPSI